MSTACDSCGDSDTVIHSVEPVRPDSPDSSTLDTDEFFDETLSRLEDAAAESNLGYEYLCGRCLSEHDYYGSNGRA